VADREFLYDEKGCINAVHQKGGELLGYIQYPHPDDAHLVLVLVHLEPLKFVVWTFNRNDGGFHNGDYFEARPDEGEEGLFRMHNQAYHAFFSKGILLARRLLNV
jgi:hypothetical protein